MEPPQGTTTPTPTYSRTEIGARIKMFRHAAGLTQSDIAGRTGLSIGFVSQVENGVTSVSLQSLYRISGALGVTAPALLSDDAGPQISVVRAADGPWYELITGEGPLARDMATSARHHVEARENFLPGGWIGDQPWTHAGLEFLHVISGTMTVELVGQRKEELQPGDSMLFPAHIPHKWGATGVDVKVLEIVTHAKGIARHTTLPADQA